MSIYSGFATRRDESKYNDLLSRLLSMLQHHLLQFIKQTEIPHKKIVGYTKVIAKMKQYEQHKYLPPKFSELLQPLCKTLGINYSQDVNEYQKPTGQDRASFQLERLRAVKFSTEKCKIKQRALENNMEADRQGKKSSLLLKDKLSEYSSRGQAKKKMFEQASEQKEKMGNNNGQRQGSEFFQEESEKNNSKTQYNKIAASHPVIISAKVKNNLRYRAMHALGEVQENNQKRQTPLREEMRRRLKTTTEPGGGQL